MAICPYCKGEVTMKTVEKERYGTGLIKQEILYACPNCKCVLGFSRGRYGG